MNKEILILEKQIKAEVEKRLNVNLLSCDLCSDGILLEFFYNAESVSKVYEVFKNNVKDFFNDEATGVVSVWVAY